MQRVTAVLITLNEELNLKRTLPQLNWCDEIIVVDSGSTDNTVQICRNFGCKVVHRAFDGYGTQKQFAVSLSRNNWILSIDADEVLSDELVDEIKTEMEAPRASGYLLPMNLVFLGKEFTFGKESNRFFLRLFNKQFGNYNNRKVHEGIELSGEKIKLKNKILHYSYKDISQYFKKLNTYSSFGANLAFEKGKNKSVFTVVSTIPLNFMKYYFLHGNIFNGANGFYWSIFNTYYHLVKYLKIRELHDQNLKLEIESKHKKETVTILKEAALQAQIYSLDYSEEIEPRKSSAI
jgi:glycosyltransferase involved in cell wall biosynthesis